MSVRRTGGVLTLVGTALLVLSGCGNVADDDVARVATAFAQDGQDAAARCALLAPTTLATLTGQESSSCPDAIGNVQTGSGRLVSVEVWGEEAQAKLTDDTLFLTRTPRGWRVLAAGCKARSQQQPYDCQLQAS
ncbi:MAG: hypothetical protein QOJ68_2082 [Blastococcus sp.]|jgi:hypothetical protein|nr:hypothetical protein [Blastococcus sp.]